MQVLRENDGILDGKIIVLAHQKGGVGKSTIASNLAVELTKRYQTDVLDIDMQHSLSAFVASRGDRTPKISMLTRPSTCNELMTMMDNHKKGVLIIDTGGFDMDIQRIAMLGADLIITPLKDTSMEIHGLTVFAKTIAKLRESRPDLKASILFNNVHLFAGKSLDDLMNDIITSNNGEFDAMGAVLRNRKAYSEACYQGVSVVELDSKSEAATEIKMLIEDIEKRLA